MSSHSVSQLATYLEPILALAALAVMAHGRQLRRFGLLSLFLVADVFSSIVLSAVLYFAGHGIETAAAYHFYFYAYWITYAMQALLLLALAFQLYRSVTEPLRGLRRLGLYVFAAAAAVIFASGSWLLLHSPSIHINRSIMNDVILLANTKDVLTLVIVLLIVLLIRPLALSLRNKFVGIALGLAVLSLCDLTFSMLRNTSAAYSLLTVLYAATFLLATGIWITYFLLPESQHRPFSLPETSSLLRWNQFWLTRIGGGEPA